MEITLKKASDYSEALITLFNKYNFQAYLKLLTEKILNDSVVLLDESGNIIGIVILDINSNIRTVDTSFFKLTDSFFVYPVKQIYSFFARGYLEGKYRYIITTMITDNPRAEELSAYVNSRLDSTVHKLKIGDKEYPQHIVDCDKVLKEGLYKDEKLFEKDITQKFD